MKTPNSTNISSLEITKSTESTRVVDRNNPSVRDGLKVKSGVKAGGLSGNHSTAPARAGLKVKSALKSGGLSGNHNAAPARIRCGYAA